MISGYKTNKQKYENSIQYVNNHSNMSEDLKKDVVAIMQKYRISIFCMEEQEVYDLIEQCAEDASSIVFKRELHAITRGSSGYSNDNSYYYESSGIKDKDNDDEYNLD